MAANFNNSAWFYDRLARLVYGKALIEAQVWLLQYIPANSKVLIAGGGTGWILEEIANVHPAGLQITYIEVAPAMMAKSKKRDAGSNIVTYINEAIENVALPASFDVIITPFLFDNFTEYTLSGIFNSIHNTLKPGGLWLNAGFQLSGKWWQHILLKSMFLFFWLVCNIEAKRLPDIHSKFIQRRYIVLGTKTFYRDFIRSTALQKMSDE